MAESSMFYFMEFLNTLSAGPTKLQFKEMAGMLGISESTLSKMRHGRLRKIPAGLEPVKNAAPFAQKICGKFPNTPFTARQFLGCGDIIVENFTVSRRLVQSLESLRTQWKKCEITGAGFPRFFEGSLPAWLAFCYEEAYMNSMSENARLARQKYAVSEVLYRRLCTAVERDILDAAQLERLSDVITRAQLAGGVRALPDGDSPVQMVRRMINWAGNIPFYKSSRRRELVSISEDQTTIRRTIFIEEFLSLVGENPADYVLKLEIHHAVPGEPRALAERCFQNFSCTVDGKSLEDYCREHGMSGRPEELIRVVVRNDDLLGEPLFQVVFRLRLYSAAPGKPVCVRSNFVCEMPFYRNISSSSAFRLIYPCRFLEHEFALDSQTSHRWGVRFSLFLADMDGRGVENSELQGKGTPDSCWVASYDWLPPGCGYMWHLYELKYI